MQETPANWPFVEGTNVAVITTRQVIEEDYPVLVVSHDDDGEWQFLCGTTTEVEDGRVVGLGTIYERDPALGALADLPLGWVAWRETTQSEWLRTVAPSG